VITSFLALLGRSQHRCAILTRAQRVLAAPRVHGLGRPLPAEATRFQKRHKPA